MPDQHMAEHFEAQLGSLFELRPHDAPALDIELAQVRRGAEQPQAPRPKPFTLTFTAPPGATLPQATYVLHHQILGALEIFLVPVGRGRDGTLRLEAVFN